MNLSEPFIRRPVMTAVLTVSVILFGVLAYRGLPVNDLPAVDYPVIQVQADYPGASPETVANNIATPLERQFMQINGLELVTSKSTQGHTSMTLQFALSKSIDGAATDVQTAITQATGSLPVDLPSPPTFSKTNPNDQPIMYIALTSDSVTAGQLYDYASTQVGQRISILPGVSRVNVFGTKSAVQRNMRRGTLDVEVRLPDEPDSALTGALTFLDNAVQDGTGNVTLRATIPNAGHRLWPGRFVKVRLVLSTLPGAVLVPAAAPQMSARGQFVYVVKQDATAELRLVKTGQRHGALVVIDQGVSAGERIVVNGQLGVTPGGQVREEPNATAKAPDPTNPRGES